MSESSDSALGVWDQIWWKIAYFLEKWLNLCPGQYSTAEALPPASAQATHFRLTYQTPRPGYMPYRQLWKQLSSTSPLAASQILPKTSPKYAKSTKICIISPISAIYQNRVTLHICTNHGNIQDSVKKWTISYPGLRSLNCAVRISSHRSHPHTTTNGSPLSGLMPFSSFRIYL